MIKSNNQRKKISAIMFNVAYALGIVKPLEHSRPVTRPTAGSYKQRALVKQANKLKKEKRQLQQEAKSPKQQKINSGYAKLMWFATLPLVTELQ